MSKPLENRIAVVTGASRGIGFAIALKLAGLGAHVIALARTVGGLEELDDKIRSQGGSATLVPTDLRKPDDLDRLGAAIHERWGKLDILVGNAGVLGKLTPVGHFETKVWDEVIAVNLTANWRLIRSLDPLLQRSDSGRAVFLTSAAAGNAEPYWGAYAASKAALESLVLTYANENRTNALCVNLFDPGPVRTALRARAMPGENPAGLTRPPSIAEAAAGLCLPEHEGSGRIYGFHEGQLQLRASRT
jgi:NAD(P)-dependent dehydrogenase (short-subunit alcohol dehydrogenase family)